jgi:hypothetical protein
MSVPAVRASQSQVLDHDLHQVISKKCNFPDPLPRAQCGSFPGPRPVDGFSGLIELDLSCLRRFAPRYSLGFEGTAFKPRVADEERVGAEVLDGMPGASWAGASAAPCARTSCSMRWSRLCVTVSQTKMH